jgi:lysophospholipase L1-like esterase
VKRLLLTVGLVLCVGVAGAQAADKEFFFRPTDDPIVFLGDSITQQRMYTAYIEAYVLTRFPDWKLHFRNLGWGGDTSWLRMRGGIDNGLQRDVYPLHPQAMTIDFGMNDARLGARTVLPLYRRSLDSLVSDAQAHGIRVALLTATPRVGVQSNQPGGTIFNRTLAQLCGIARQTAQERQVPFVDQFDPFVQDIALAQTASLPTLALVPDTIHPSWAGHLLMAYQILKQLHAPSLVSRVVLEASQRRVLGTERCSVTGLDFRRGRIAFTRRDECLPMPVRPESEIVFQVPGFNFSADLNQYTLQINGLSAGDYDIHLDGEPLGTFSARELGGGVNLSLHCGALSRQGLRLLDKVLAKNDSYFQRWRQVQLLQASAKQPVSDAWRARELARLDASIAHQEADIDALRHPGPHQWVITRNEQASLPSSDTMPPWD